ncbi:hypothetical protein VNO78_08332 [Psophocarpus tetragonolobus]|uniref:GATA-type domain-containing protein n=1 Tax=Psophocarpus tetragonolobus TaxID=3891 RepID=A0AAN9XSI4_PSOTE
MNRYCSGSEGQEMGGCRCGMFHSQGSSFSMCNNKPPYDIYDYSSSVDCTLSLGTPSTRFTQDQENRTRNPVSNFYWDILQVQSKHNPQSHTPTTDTLQARRCANCDTTSTPLWRNGPRGPKSLCNACGIRYKKEERRASAAVAAPAAGSAVMESAQLYNNPCYGHPQSQKMRFFSSGLGNEFRFVDEGHPDVHNAIPFLSWRLNVTDRTSILHDFTI